jgi:hypothetical protein
MLQAGQIAMAQAEQTFKVPLGRMPAGFNPDDGRATSLRQRPPICRSKRCASDDDGATRAALPGAGDVHIHIPILDDA